MKFELPGTLSKTVFLLIILIGSASCRRTAGSQPGGKIQLASSAENQVQVGIELENKGSNQFLLSATFTPLTPDLHLYSKDIPKTGVGGLGRPTLLELMDNSSIQKTGDLIEDVPSHIPEFEPKDLLIYPAGPVVLSIPILITPGQPEIKEPVFVTYMACNQQGCRPPVEGKAISITIPRISPANP